MKRHNQKTLRQGCSVWFMRMDWRTGEFVVARVMVGSDNMPEPNPAMMYDIYPRSYLIRAMSERDMWDHKTRRSAQRECDRINRWHKSRKRIFKGDGHA